MKYYYLRDPRTKDCKLPKFGKALSHFRMDVGYESGPCCNCVRLHYLRTDPHRSAKNYSSIRQEQTNS